MDGQLATVLVSGLVSLIGAFGSILLKDHLDQRREARRLGGAESARRPADPAPDAPRTAGAHPAATPAGPTTNAMPKRQRRAGAALVVIATLLTGFVVGTLARTAANAGASDDGPVSLSFIGLGAATLALLVYHSRPRRRSLLAYELSALTLWAAFFAGFSSDEGASYMIEAVEIFAAASALLGLVVFGIAALWRSIAGKR